MPPRFRAKGAGGMGQVGWRQELRHCARRTVPPRPPPARRHTRRVRSRDSVCGRAGARRFRRASGRSSAAPHIAQGYWGNTIIRAAAGEY